MIVKALKTVPYFLSLHSDLPLTFRIETQEVQAKTSLSVALFY